ncbi:hypothetical protein THTE_2698 [Thermogutta terrifontis]|uniref:Uncharacterized protein n=1 Tax=Thermogutta terrifontis TaxID=1331910 RepID=A0A286RH73_9BACT|nr:hypothetical protein THTE_2698 [Thermogutta terrifontis]
MLVGRQWIIQRRKADEKCTLLREPGRLARRAYFLQLNKVCRKAVAALV